MQEAITVRVADGKFIQSTHRGTLSLPGVGTMPVHMLPNLHASLLSISSLVNIGLKAVFDQTHVRLFRNNDEVLTGKRDIKSGLWFIDLSEFQSLPTQPQCNINHLSNSEILHSAIPAVRLTTADDTVDFWHKTFGSPCIATFTLALQKNWIVIPGINAAMVRRHQPHTVETSLGHLTSTRQGLRSTKPKVIPLVAPDILSATPVQPLIFINVYECTGRMHSDAAGRFPIKSVSGNIYMIIFYSEDSNFIHVECTPSRRAADLLSAFQRAVTFFKSRNCSIRFARMDNECSQATKQWAADNASIAIELVPPGQHRTNLAERAIQTWKSHFISILAGVDPDCPKYLWELFIEQAELTLNLMRPYTPNSEISAWEGLCGKFNINATPIAPLGTKVVVFEPADKRESWAQHGELGFYIGRALLHYRCFSVWVARTQMVRVSDTVAWHPVRIKMPGSAPINSLTTAIEQMSALLQEFLACKQLSSLHTPAKTIVTQLLHHYADVEAIEELYRHRPIPSGPPPGFPPLPIHGGLPNALDIAAQQRVIDITAQQRVPITGNVITPLIPTPIQDAPPSTSQPTTNIGPTSHIRPPMRHRSQHSYLTLTPIELKRIKAHTLKRIGCQFIDDEDPNDIFTGTVESIVRHKQSRKLAFKYWDHINQPAKPKRNNAYSYLDVTYGLTNCRWSSVSALTSALASIAIDEGFRNRGPTRTQKRNSRRHTSESAPWYHSLIHRANAASNLQTLVTHKIQELQEPYLDLSAFTAQDLNADGTRLTSTSALRGPEREKWITAHGEEIVRLIESKTGIFIHRSAMPRDRKAAYYNPQLKIKVKSGVIQYRVRGTIGGDQVHYPGATTAYTAALETIRILLNAVVSEDAEFMTADIKDFYLGTPLDRTEYMRINLKHIPRNIQLRYSLDLLAHDGHVIMEIHKGIYGLPQAGKLAQDRLIAHLAKNGYHQCINTPCLFIHENNGVAFTLVVDDFLIKYPSRSAAEHLLNVLRELYEITADLARVQKYVGITLKHNKGNRTICMSMPGYVKKALIRFKRLQVKGANSPITYVKPNYGPYTQQVTPEIQSEPLTAEQRLELQEIVGVFLFYARAVDPLMITAINKIGSAQATATTQILEQVERFISYASKFPDATLRIRASDMKLYAHSDASYLSEPKARSRAGGYLFLGNCSAGDIPNAAISYFSVIISTVVTSATEAEYAALFMTGQAAISIRNTLADLGYPQGTTQLICDNKCAVGIAQNTLKLKRSKTIDMRYHWIRDQVLAKTFNVTWQSGNSNLADFFTKAHPVHHHLAMRKFYVVVDDITDVIEASIITSSEGVLV